MNKKITPIIVLLVIIVILVLGFFALMRFATRSEPEFLQGQIEARRVMVAGKLPGRVSELSVREGDFVEKGDLIAMISSPEVEAKRMQAEGALDAAKAQATKAKRGARAEEIAAAKAMLDRAADAAELAKTTYERVQKLYDEGVVPIQKRDEAEVQMSTSKAAAQAAKAQYDQAIAGARDEDKAAANALVMQAKGARAEVDAYLSETKIISPISGEVTLKIAEEGEVIGAGMPVVAVTDLNDAWAVFNFREDMLQNISEGKTLKLYVPALDLEIETKVYYIASAGDYATWRSSKESGGFDLKTFEVRLRPEKFIPNLRPGMTVLLSLKNL